MSHAHSDTSLTHMLIPLIKSNMHTYSKQEKLRCMYGYIQSMHSTGTSIRFTHTCRIWKQHTHTHSHTYTIDNSITQTKSEPKGFPLWEFCKQISRQCDLFPLCLSWLYNKLRNNFIYVLLLYFLVEALVGALKLMSVMGVDSTWLWFQGLQSSWEPVLIMQKYTLFQPTHCPSPVFHLQPGCHQQPRDWAFVIIIIIHHSPSTSSSSD